MTQCPAWELFLPNPWLTKYICPTAFCTYFFVTEKVKPILLGNVLYKYQIKIKACTSRVVGARQTINTDGVQNTVILKVSPYFYPACTAAAIVQSEENRMKLNDTT